jgi:hypothetical protein
MAGRRIVHRQHRGHPFLAGAGAPPDPLNLRPLGTRVWRSLGENEEENEKVVDSRRTTKEQKRNGSMIVRANSVGIYFL